MESLNCARVAGHIFRKNLEGDDAPHFSMLSLEYLAHSSGTNLVQEDIIPEDDDPGRRTEQLLRLKARKPPPVDQLPSNGFRIAINGGTRSVDIIACPQTALDEAIPELFRRRSHQARFAVQQDRPPCRATVLAEAEAAGARAPLDSVNQRPSLSVTLGA